MTLSKILAILIEHFLIAILIERVYLIVTLDVLGRSVVNDATNVRLVYPHPEGDSGGNALRRTRAVLLGGELR